jgi:Ca2+-transporting ATPase
MPKISYYNIDYQDVLNKLGSDREKGLSKNEVSKRQQQFGSNEIADDRPKHLVLKILWNQFNNLLVLILAISAIITYFLGNKLDTYVIIFAILSDAIIGFVQEYRANKAIESLKEIVVATSKVYRDGQLIEIPAKNLVPGDIVLLEEGERLPRHFPRNS